MKTIYQYGIALALSTILLLGPGSAPASSGTEGPDAAAGSGPRTEGTCPPVHLYDEAGALIDPVHGINDTRPYSPRKTCGRCHDYEKITEGYHFTQGAGEQPTPEQSARCAWVSTPGNYGGTWCSPAPLYRYLSAKRNESAAVMDMTSYTFVTAGCGSCHPGGGPLEYDRDGRRYDERMRDPESGLVSGGDNGLDGDYYRARWDVSGVLEADCLLCHQPTYDFAARDAQLNSLNYRWAATAGAGLASVKGSVKDDELPVVEYDLGLFDGEGRLDVRIIRQPRNETCLQCHAKPGYKKRGADFRPRTDVHLRAGLKCVDCHPAGSSADDPRIKGKEVHQFGKGDDPGGHVRDDLDNTARDCDSCHSTGMLGAPIAVHAGLPPLHMEHLACQACHIPERTVKAALFQAGDVFNPGARIPSKGKHLWTFYGPDMEYWNHYGDLELMGYDDKPTWYYRPVLAEYKGKVYPVNRVHSAWTGIETAEGGALMQPRMSDIFGMWKAHREDPDRYPELARIVDDNGDNVPEVNRAEEIDALLAAVTRRLHDVNYPLEGRRVVWVSNDRVHSSGTEFRTLAMESWEASPYGSVHKYSHDVYPARAALGANGCSDCHAADSPFFFAQVTAGPFDEEAQPVFAAQHSLMGYDGRPREYRGGAGTVSAFFRVLTTLVLGGLLLHIVLDFLFRKRSGAVDPKQGKMGENPEETIPRFNTHYLAQHLMLMISVGILILSAVFLWGLRYPGAGWAATLTGALGGVETWRAVHRAAGVILILTCAYHAIYSLVHPEGRRDFRLLIPRGSDFRDFGANIKRFVGLRKDAPRFGRFTYYEKFDYWAVFWGCAIMIGSGLVMWFPGGVGRLLPGVSAGFFDAFKEAHAHEAVLATLAIAIWHIYNVHFRPGRFPGSLFFLHGRISRREQEMEHGAEALEDTSLVGS